MKKIIKASARIGLEKLKVLWSAAVLSSFLFAACSAGGDPIPDNIIPPGKTPKDGVFAKRGDNSFVYTKYAPLAGKPITVYYYIPTKGNIADMPVLFSMHGAERDGTIQRNAWKYFAEANEFIVIAPEYTHTNGYLENDYQFGGIFTSNAFAELNPKEKWTYQTIEALFDYFLKETDSKATTYNIFGHSAGGQFVHRFLLSMPTARVNKAVAANPGSWTFPYIEGIVGTDDKVYGWPYAVKNSPFNTENIITQFFSKKVWIQLGQLDTDENDSSLPKDAPSNAQGPHRLARGRFFYTETKRIAEDLNVPYNFQKAEVTDAGHSTIRMVYGRPVSNPSDISNTGQNCAFDLLFK
ncbi:hypothetical protein G5B30_04770 [Sphingobacterium sp. SGG-5]|uniref:hypothetical protein n=1 Tax=Sphingobacterium sp. SGG-5 TaxID=2710881 RepID=UPI0013EADC27|nr:hypothetical protein [Sphingobacterium sp. SGG-5]NGM61230.1 hypothetical protein [Sphingobacterium sp. SGG-5]